MKFNYARLGTSLILVVFLGACSLPQGNPTTDPGIVATKVAETLAAFTQSAQQTPRMASSSPTPVQPTIAPGTHPAPSETVVPDNTLSPTLLPSATLGPTPSPTPGLGTIAGSITGYPYGPVPALAIVAFGQDAPSHFWFWITGAGSTSYSMDGYITTGHYQVVAYDSSGHSGGCAIIVEVLNNQTVTCDISNWGGSYPTKPSVVPNP
jgi:hypothetical protein